MIVRKSKPQRNWTDYETAKLIQLKKDGHSIEYIAGILNRTKRSVYNKISQERLHTEIFKIFDRWSKEEIEALKSLKSEGLKYIEISKRLGRTEESCRCKSYVLNKQL